MRGDKTGFGMSSGMKARLMLARAILPWPRVLILDEPTGAIDPIAAFDLLGTIQQISSEHGLATLISSHRVEEIEALRDNVMFLDRGRVVYWGDLEVVRQLWERTRYELSFSSQEARENAIRRLTGINDSEVQRVGEDGISLLTDEEAGPLLGRLQNDLQSIRTMTQHRMPLRELLRAVLARPDQDTGSK